MNEKASRVRFGVLALLFVVTSLNYADRSALSIAGAAAQKQLGMNTAALGYVLSAFGWGYVLGQVPGGILLDRFGSRRVYAISLICWSSVTVLQGLVGNLPGILAVAALFVLQLLLGAAESPIMPGNSRLVAAWFPSAERGTAAATFNSAQYFSIVMFAPLIGWVTHTFGWQYVFVTMGVLGFAMLAPFARTVHGPAEHPRVNRAELEQIRAGAGLVDLDEGKRGSAPFRWDHARQILGNRMLLGVFIGQYCITTLTYFFLTWFPVYLIHDRGMSILKAGFVASLPAVCGFVGGILGGVISDSLLRAGWTLAAARKTPIVLGMLLSTSMIVCNYVSGAWIAVGIMCVAFFGKGVGSLGWAVISDMAPRQAAGLCAGVFNTFGNAAAITTPLIIGQMVQRTHTFHAALVFVAANAVGAIVSFLVVLREIERVELY